VTIFISSSFSAELTVNGNNSLFVCHVPRTRKVVARICRSGVTG